MTHNSEVLTLESGNPPAGLNGRWMVLGVCIFLAEITWLVFGQTLRYQFVYDDGDYVLKNSQVARGLTLEGIVWAFTHVHSSNWHPLTWISHMLDCQFYGLNPGGHHFTNVLLHLATAILLFLLLRQMTGTLGRSAFVTAVFAIHPLRVESVAWVAERKDVLSGLFFVLTIGAYVRYTRGPWSNIRYGLVVLSLAMGLMCKPMLVTMPFVLLLLDYWPLNRFTTLQRQGEGHSGIARRRLILEKLPLLGLGLVSCAVTLFAQRESLAPVAKISPILRLANAAVAYTDYLRQMFWPSDLAVFYPWEGGRLGVSNTVASIILLTGISAAVFALRRMRYLVTGWLWYLAMLVPVIGIVQVGNQARADRYTYLPQIGLYLLLTWGVVELCAGWRYRHVLFASLSSVILTALIFSARAQASYWQNGETLWSHALACTTDKSIAEGNLGQACYANGKMREAMMHFENSLRIAPNQAPVYSNLGAFFLEMGQMNEALAHFQKALEIEPRFAVAHYNLGNTYREMGQVNEALFHYNRALEIDPNDTDALNNTAWILATWPDAPIRDGAKAIELAERANSLTRCRSPSVNATLAAAYAEAGRFGEALKTGERALQLASAEISAVSANSIRTQIEVYRSGAAFRDYRSATSFR